MVNSRSANGTVGASHTAVRYTILVQHRPRDVYSPGHSVPLHARWSWHADGLVEYDVKERVKSCAIGLSRASSAAARLELPGGPWHALNPILVPTLVLRNPLHRPRLESSLAVGHHVLAALRPISNEESRLPEAVELSGLPCKGILQKKDAVTELKTSILDFFPRRRSYMVLQSFSTRYLVMSTEAYSTIHGSFFRGPPDVHYNRGVQGALHNSQLPLYLLDLPLNDSVAPRRSHWEIFGHG